MHPVSDTWHYNGVKILSEWYPADRLPSNIVIRQVYGFCYRSDGKLLIIRSPDNNSWTLPGGTPEGYETFSDTLHREVEEESSVEIFNPRLLGYAKNQYVDNTGYHLVYQLRCFASIRSVNKLHADPNEGIVRKRRFIDPKNFEKYLHWGRLGRAILHQSLLCYEEYKNRN